MVRNERREEKASKSEVEEAYQGFVRRPFGIRYCLQKGSCYAKKVSDGFQGFVASSWSARDVHYETRLVPRPSLHEIFENVVQYDTEGKRRQSRGPKASNKADRMRFVR